MRQNVYPATIALLLLGACTTEETPPDSGPQVVIDAGFTDSGSSCALGTLPAAYPLTSSIAFAANASVELGILMRNSALKKVMEDAEKDPMRRPTEADLMTAFGSGTPSLRSITSTYYT